MGESDADQSSRGSPAQSDQDSQSNQGEGPPPQVAREGEKLGRCMQVTLLIAIASCERSPVPEDSNNTLGVYPA